MIADMTTRRPDGFMARLIGPDKVVLDCKFFSTPGAAVKYVTGAGLEAAEGDVAQAEVWSPNGDLVWYKVDTKVEEQAPERWTPEQLHWSYGTRGRF
jgi:hypothetical protein